MKSIDDINRRLAESKNDYANCLKWYNKALENYNRNRQYGEADSTEYLYAGEEAAKIKVEITTLEWVLNLVPTEALNPA